MALSGAPLLSPGPCALARIRFPCGHHNTAQRPTSNRETGTRTPAVGRWEPASSLAPPPHACVPPETFSSCQCPPALCIVQFLSWSVHRRTSWHHHGQTVQRGSPPRLRVAEAKWRSCIAVLPKHSSVLASGSMSVWLDQSAYGPSRRRCWTTSILCQCSHTHQAAEFFLPHAGAQSRCHGIYHHHVLGRIQHLCNVTAQTAWSHPPPSRPSV